MVVADSEKAAVSDHRVGDLAGHLVDHHAFDAADLLLVGAVDGGAFDLVAADEREGLALAGYELDHLSADGNLLRSKLYGRAEFATRAEGVKHL